MSLTLLPDLGDLLRLQPQFNAGTVVEALRYLGAQEVWWATGRDPDHPLRDALPAAGVTLHEAAPDWSWADAEHEQLLSFLGQYPQGRERLKRAAQAGRELAALVAAPLTLPQALSPDVLTTLQRSLDAEREALDEGPGTRWRARRLGETAQALAAQDGVALVPLDDLPGLLPLLSGAALPDLSGFAPGDTSRLRALADRAWQLSDSDDLGSLLAALEREAGDPVTPRAELDAAEAHIYLAVGELAAARARLERAAHALTDHLPRSLAGLVLARLGQVRDAQGERDLARRTYQATLALGYAPQVAREAAQAGLDTPFTLALG